MVLTYANIVKSLKFHISQTWQHLTKEMSNKLYQIASTSENSCLDSIVSLRTNHDYVHECIVCIICMYVCMYVCVCVSCVCVRVRVRACVHAYMHVCIFSNYSLSPNGL